MAFEAFWQDFRIGLRVLANARPLQRE